MKKDRQHTADRSKYKSHLQYRKALVNRIPIKEDTVNEIFNIAESLSSIKKGYYSKTKKEYMQNLVNRFKSAGLKVTDVSCIYDIEVFISDFIEIEYKKRTYIIRLSRSSQTMWIDNNGSYGTNARSIKRLLILLDRQVKMDKAREKEEKDEDEFDSYSGDEDHLDEDGYPIDRPQRINAEFRLNPRRRGRSRD